MAPSGKRSNRSNDGTTAATTGTGTSTDAVQETPGGTPEPIAEADLATVAPTSGEEMPGLTDSDLGRLAEVNAAAAESTSPEPLSQPTPPRPVAAEHHSRTSTVHLPFVTASFTRTSNGPSWPNPLAALADAGQAVTTAVASVPREKAVFYIGVGTLGVLGVVDWPVAAVVAAGAYVASRAYGRDAGAAHGTASTDASESPNFPHT
jgi:hypothetical protein